MANLFLFCIHRQICSLIECKVNAHSQQSFYDKSQLTSPPRVSALQLHPSDTSSSSSFTSNVVSSLFHLSPMTYVLGLFIPHMFLLPVDLTAAYLTSSHTMGANHSSGNSDWSVAMEYVKCGMYFVCRGLPSVVTAKIVNFTG